MTDGTHPLTDRTSKQHSEILQAIHRLEAALVAPAPGRERDWAARITADLQEVCRRLEAHCRAVEGPDGLYEELETEMPGAGQRIRYLKDTNRYLLERAGLLLREAERVTTGEGGAFMAVRAHGVELMAELRQQQAREVDLIFEAFDRETGVPH